MLSSAARTVGDVLPQGVTWAAMDEQDVIHDASLREGAEPRAGRLGHGVAGPLGCRARLRVEPIDLRTSDSRGIVIAAHPSRIAFTEACHDGVRLRTVADHVAEVPDGIDVAGIGQDRVEGHDVAMDIG